jgi:Reverse transcriptase (RNA-dependent DNA polymerase)
MCTVKISSGNHGRIPGNTSTTNKHKSHEQVQLRWDHADLASYYRFTGEHLEPVSRYLNELSRNYDKNIYQFDFKYVIDQVYDDIVNTLVIGANQFVPQCRKNFFKFWWDEEMNLLKEASIESNVIWKAAGKPKYGPIFSKRQSCRLQYRKRIRENQNNETSAYSNDLHDALMEKNGPTFWKVWRSKFESKNKLLDVEGDSDAYIIADKFALFFSQCCSANNVTRAAELFADFTSMRENYCGSAPIVDNEFSVELVSNIILKLKRGKAAGLDSLTAEHLIHCHPSLPCILSKLFNLMLWYGYLPREFGQSYTVPLIKDSGCHTKSTLCSDFRGIAINCILSKVLEHCILDRFNDFFSTNENQFGFKKNSSCSHAIYSVRTVVNRFIDGGSTASLCTIDLSKAFDKVNHHALYIKLMKRRIPIKLLNLLVYWLDNCFSCVKWDGTLSHVFKLEFGVRQGSVLSPFLFAIYLDDLIDFRRSNYSNFVILYADDIMLLSRSVCELQRMLTVCERELSWLDMSINSKKSCCMRIGPRCNFKCSNLTTSCGSELPWVTDLRYLGIQITQSRLFKCSFDRAKRAFHRSLNAVYGRVGRNASEEVIIKLVTSKCLPILLYGTEACPISKSDMHSLDFAINRFLMKLFKTNNILIVNECRDIFGIDLPSFLIHARTSRFMLKINCSDNILLNLFS